MLLCNASPSSVPLVALTPPLPQSSKHLSHSQALRETAVFPTNISAKSLRAESTSNSPLHPTKA